MGNIIVIVQFSGGKDSLASLLWAVDKYGKENIVAIFCDTQWEHELTYKHIQEVISKLGVKFITLKGKYSFLELVKKKLRFPSTKARFCTEWLKIRPFIDYLLNIEYEYSIIIQGIRSDESRSRSKMTQECQYFKYYFTPYGFKKDGKPKFMSYRKKEIVTKGLLHKTDIYRPFFNSTANEVMNFIKSFGFKPNPLYYMGFKRVGCFPCIMCTKSEMDLIIKKQPQYLERIKIAEEEYQSTFFPVDYIPNYAKEEFKTKRGTFKLPTIKAVIKYLKGRNKHGEMFAEEENKSCMSMYNICE
jgi:3'-phosphoadenosine 5'-phosphosulfate sulfotransferase (PAPS reductase)/FAD synthetase